MDCVGLNSIYANDRRHRDDDDDDDDYYTEFSGNYSFETNGADSYSNFSRSTYRRHDPREGEGLGLLLGKVFPCTPTNGNKCTHDVTDNDDSTYVSRDTEFSQGDYSNESNSHTEFDDKSTLDQKKRSSGNSNGQSNRYTRQYNLPTDHGRPLEMSESDEEISALMGLTQSTGGKKSGWKERVVNDLNEMRNVSKHFSTDLNLRTPTSGAFSNHSLQQYPPSRRHHKFDFNPMQCHNFDRQRISDIPEETNESDEYRDESYNVHAQESYRNSATRTGQRDPRPSSSGSQYSENYPSSERTPNGQFPRSSDSVHSRRNGSFTESKYRGEDQLSDVRDPQGKMSTFSPSSRSVMSNGSRSNSSVVGGKHRTLEDHLNQKFGPKRQMHCGSVSSRNSASVAGSRSSARYLSGNESMYSNRQNGDLGMCLSTSTVGSRVKVATAYGTVESELEQINVPPGDMGLKLRSSEEGLVIARKAYNSVCPELSVGDIIVALDGVDISSFPAKTVKKLLEARKGQKNRAIIFKPGFLSEKSSLLPKSDSHVWLNPTLKQKNKEENHIPVQRFLVESNSHMLSPSNTTSSSLRSEGTFLSQKQKKLPPLNGFMSPAKHGMRRQTRTN